MLLVKQSTHVVLHDMMVGVCLAGRLTWDDCVSEETGGSTRDLSMAKVVVGSIEGDAHLDILERSKVLVRGAHVAYKGAPLFQHNDVSKKPAITSYYMTAQYVTWLTCISSGILCNIGDLNNVSQREGLIDLQRK